MAGGLQAAVQDSPLPNVAADPAAAERGKQTEQQLEARLDELEKHFATRAEAIGAMLTDAAVQALLVPQEMDGSTASPCPDEGINAIISRAIEINTVAQQISTGLLGDRTVTGSSSIDDFLDVEHRRSIWIKCTGGVRAGQWREVWPYSKVCKEGGTEMVRFRCFEDERHTARGRKTWYDICTVSHAEARKPDGVPEPAVSAPQPVRATSTACCHDCACCHV